VKDLRRLAQKVADALPGDEIVLTGSVSRGMADDVSDIEMLIVTPQALDLETCFHHAAAAGLEHLDTWGPQGGPTQRVSGRREDVPLELIWWSSAQVEQTLDGIMRGEGLSSAEAIANGVALRTAGGLARWQERLAEYPDELALAQIDDAALTWGGFAAAGLLTIARPAERLARLERMVDDATRVLRIVYALNRVWPATTKRVAARTASLAVKPERLAERIDEALAEQDPRRALLLMTELQLETVLLAPETPNAVRARAWLADGVRLLS
jgi:hypothetical protein